MMILKGGLDDGLIPSPCQGFRHSCLAWKGPKEFEKHELGNFKFVPLLENKN
jgi:hypothetical protein